MEIVQDSECRFCLEDYETAEHLLCNCPALSLARHQKFGNYFILPNMVVKIDVRSILRFAKVTGITDIFLN